MALNRLCIPGDPEESAPLSPTLGLLHSARQELWSGIRIIRDIPNVRGVTISEALFQLAITSMTVAGIVYTQETLDLGRNASAAFALMTTFLAAGAVLGAMMAFRIERTLSRPTTKGHWLHRTVLPGSCLIRTCQASHLRSLVPLRVP